MKQENIIAVLGGGGRTGRYIVDQFLAEGYNVRLLLRRPEAFQLQHSNVEIIEGDAIDGQAINDSLKNSKAVISTIGQRPGEPLVSSRATINVIESMTEFAVDRYVLVAGINVDTPFDEKGAKTIAATEWMKTNFGLIHEDRQTTYNILSNSQVNWTLVRVPFIEFTSTTGEAIVDLKDCRGSKISARDIANFVVSQLSDHSFVRKSPFISAL